MAERISEPRLAMDYPYIPEDKFFVWVWNNVRWPDGRRYVGYMTNNVSAMGDVRLFSSIWQTAALFDTPEEARAITKDARNMVTAIVSDVWYLRRMVYDYAGSTLPVEPNPRGFGRTSFIEAHGNACSVTKSSSANEDMIWFGVDKFAVSGLINGKWKPLELPAECVSNASMLLTRDMVASLLPILTHFAETGDLRDNFNKENENDQAEV